MNKLIRRYFLIFSLVALLAVLAVSAIAAEVDASGSCGKGVEWSYSNGTLTISGNGAMTSFSSVTSQPWQKYKDDVTKVVIEEGVISVGRCAFYGFNAITEVTLPESLKEIEQYAFFSCKGLTDLSIPKNVNFIGAYAIRKSGISALRFADGDGWTFADGTVFVGDAASFKTDDTYKLDCVKTENGTGAVIASGRFHKNVFTWTLDDCGVLTVTGEGDMPKLSATTTPWRSYVSSIKKVVIGEGITSIARCSFHSCKALTEVNLPEGVTVIGEYAFYECSALSSVIIPVSVTEIGEYAFRKCHSLTEATFRSTDGWNISELTADSLKNNYLVEWVRAEHTHSFDHDYDKDCNDINCDYTREIKMQSVLLIGQSNMSGRGDLDTVEKIYDPRIKMMRNYEFVPMVEPIHVASRGGAGIGASFAKGFVESFDCEVGLIPCAEGGTSLADWAVGGALYNEAVKSAKAAMETTELCAILWHQGESDQNNENYAAELQVIFDSMIAELGLDADKLVIVTGELFGTRSDKVHRGQLELLGQHYKNYGIASSDGLKVFDVTTHFDAPSLRVFGYRYFDIFFNCITGGHYDFVDNVEHYRIVPPDTEGVKELIVSKNFNSMATGTPKESGCAFNAKAGSITVEELTPIEKYIRCMNGYDEAVGYTVDTHFDISGTVAADSVFVLKAKFKIEEGFDAEISLLKLIDSSNKTIQTVTVGRNGKLYAKQTGNNSYSKDLGYSLDVLEWTEIKVVIDLKNNQRKIFIQGYEVLSDVAAVGDTSGRRIAKVRVVQYSNKTGYGALCVDDYKCYIPDKDVFVNYICDQDFDGIEYGTYTEQTDFSGIHFRNMSDKGYATVMPESEGSSDGIVAVTANGTTPYIDLMQKIDAGTTFVIEGRFKLGEGYGAVADLLKPTPSSGSFRLVRLEKDGALYNWDYDTGKLGAKLCQLSETEWTTVTVVCDLANNVKDVYINGVLVAAGLKVYQDGITDTRLTKVRILQFSAGNGTVYVDYVRYWYI